MDSAGDAGEPMDNIHRDAVVIGAGISGLVCAYRLISSGADVLLIESSDRVGGVIRSETIDDHLIERGPNSSQGTTEFLRLVSELEIDAELVEGDPKAPAFVYFDGKIRPVPNGPGTFLTTSALSLSGKVRLLAEPFIAARADGGEESIASFAERRIGKEAAERLVGSFVSGIYAGDPRRISVQAAFPRLAALEAEHGGLIRGAIAKGRQAKKSKTIAPGPTPKRSVSFRTGMSFLPETLARKIGESLLLECSGIRISTEGGSSRYIIEFGSAAGDQIVTCDQLILATPAWAAASLTKKIAPELATLLDEIEYPPLAILYVDYAENSLGESLKGFGFLVAPSEDTPVLGCVWNSSLFPGRAPKGRTLLTVFMGGARHPQAASYEDAELISIANTELQRALRANAPPRVIGITRHQRAIPQYNLGHRDRVGRIESILAAMPGLMLTGNYLHGVSTGDCIKEAERIAKCCHRGQ
ncbi:MAG: protoporphyrinogen oxidase [Blastocatellia bacterium AA13]|nr:MAG: protoporphyrinogen oxidase [Blastocatellia bacterium AA13]